MCTVRCGRERWMWVHVHACMTDYMCMYVYGLTYMCRCINLCVLMHMEIRYHIWMPFLRCNLPNPCPDFSYGLWSSDLCCPTSIGNCTPTEPISSFFFFLNVFFWDRNNFFEFWSLYFKYIIQDNEVSEILYTRFLE